MRISRVHVDSPLAVGRHCALPEAAAHHVARVLRLKPGDRLTLFDGSGAEFDGVLRTVNREIVQAEVLERREVSRESALTVTLVQGISTGDRMDTTVQKAVELGVAAIVPVVTERCVVRLEGERATRRVAHWQATARSACEQCGRNVVPRVEPVAAFGQWIAQFGSRADGALGVLLSPVAEQAFGALAVPGRPVVLLAGPEGGLSDAEEALARVHGFVPVRLGPRILRTETAALAALAVLQALWGDFRDPA